MADAEPLAIEAVLQGFPELQSSIKSIRQQMIELEVKATKTAQNESQKRINIAKNEAKMRKKFYSDASVLVDSRMDGGFSGRNVKRRLTQSNTDNFEGIFSSFNKGFGKGQTDGFSKNFTNLGANLGKMATGLGIAVAAVSILKNGLEMAGEALEQFSSFVHSDVIKPALSLETFATQVANQSGGSVNAEDIIQAGRNIQLKYNIDQMDAAEAAASFGDKTGDISAGFELLNDVAPIVKGFGGNINDAMDQAAVIYNKLNEIDPNTSINDVRKVILAQLGQGQVKGGKFTAKEVATLGGELTKGASYLAGSGVQRITDLSAALQAGGITGKIDTSATNLNQFLTEFSVLSSKGKVPGGKKALNKEGQINDIGGAIKTALIASKGDMSRLARMGFGDQARSAMAQFVPAYQNARAQGKSPQEAAKEALLAFEKIKKATATESQVKEAAAKVMQTSGEKWDSAVNEIKDRLLEVMPEVKNFISSFKNAAPEIAKFATMIAKALAGLLPYLEAFAKIMGWVPLEKPKPEVLDPVTGKVLKPGEAVAANKDNVAQKIANQIGLGGSNGSKNQPTPGAPNQPGSPTPLAPILAANIPPPPKPQPAQPAPNTPPVQPNQPTPTNEVLDFNGLKVEAQALRDSFSKLANAADDLARKTPISGR